MENESNVKKLHATLLAGITTVLMGISLPVSAGMAEDLQDWQMNLLFHPTEEQLALEKKGQVMIYDGLTDKMVQAALDTQFDRIDSMMFTRVIVTDKKGKPKVDPVSGEVVTENDGC